MVMKGVAVALLATILGSASFAAAAPHLDPREARGGGHGGGGHGGGGHGGGHGDGGHGDGGHGDGGHGGGNGGGHGKPDLAQLLDISAILPPPPQATGSPSSMVPIGLALPQMLQQLSFPPSNKATVKEAQTHQRQRRAAYNAQQQQALDALKKLPEADRKKALEVLKKSRELMPDGVKYTKPKRRDAIPESEGFEVLGVREVGVVEEREVGGLGEWE